MKFTSILSATVRFAPRLSTRSHRVRRNCRGRAGSPLHARRAALRVEVLDRRELLSTVSGQVFEDLNGNGVQDTGELGLAGWTVFADDNENGVQDPGEVGVVTNGDGDYSLTGLAAGRRAVSEVVPDGWMQTIPVNPGWFVSRDGEFHDEFGEPLELGESDDSVVEVGLSFVFPFADGSYQDVFVSTNGFVSLGRDDGAGCCSGSVDGLIGGAPRLAPFWTDLNPLTAGDVFFNDLGDRAVITWDRVASFGGGTDANTFQIQLFPSGEVVFAYGAITTPHQFTNSMLVGLSPGAPEAPTESDFSQLAPGGTNGNLTVFELIEPGDEQWDIGDSAIRFQPFRVAPHILTISDGEDVAGVDFGNFERAAIRGQTFHDLNGNGEHDADEPGLDGWVINLLDSNGHIVATTTTTSVDPVIDPATDSGLYVFENLGPGAFRVAEAQQEGWLQVFPAPAKLAAESLATEQTTQIVRGAVDGAPGGGNAAQLLPDLIVDVENGLAEWFVDGDVVRFGQATPNIGAGPMELRGGRNLGDGTQIVVQRIYGREGRFQDREAGRFEFHAEHGHIHFNNYTQYNLRTVLPDANGDGRPEVGAVVAGGNKTSFCLVDSSIYDDTLPNFDPDPSGFGCDDVQRISVGWEDIYDPYTEGQEIDITDLPRGPYWLEAIVDPDNHLLEADETNNTSRVLVDLNDAMTGGPPGHTVELTSGASFDDLDFGNFRGVTLSGRKFWDRDADGRANEADSPLADWLIYIDANRDGVLNNPVVGNGVCDAFAEERCTRTGSDGAYRFDMVGPGTHAVREASPANWRQTLGDHDVVAASGVDRSGLDFGNAKDPLTVADVRLNIQPKGRRAVREIAISFSEALDAAVAATRAHYLVTLAGKDNRLGTRDDRAAAVRTVRYDDATATVTLSTRKRLEPGQFVRLVVTAGGVVDAYGGALDGDGDGAAGGNFAAILGVGTSFVYFDRDGDQVAIGLQGGGLIELLRGVDGEAQRVRLVGTIANSSVLSGGVTRSGGGDGRTSIATITGIAGVQNNLPSPPFTLGDVSAALVDSVLASIVRR